MDEYGYLNQLIVEDKIKHEKMKEYTIE